MLYRFGIFELDDRTAILTRSDRPVALEPQPARALALLLSRAGCGSSATGRSDRVRIAVRSSSSKIPNR